MATTAYEKENTHQTHRNSEGPNRCQLNLLLYFVPVDTNFIEISYI